MGSINRQQPEQNREDLSGAPAVARIKELVDETLADVFIANLEIKLEHLDNVAEDDARTREMLRDLIKGAVETADQAVIESGRGKKHLKPIVEFRAKRSSR